MNSVNTDIGRIQLAEAMDLDIWHKYISPRSYPEKIVLPDPFTDASDDYAVKQHFERRALDHPEEWERFKDYWREVRGEWNVWNYKIGDFARAGLHMLSNTDEV